MAANGPHGPATGSSHLPLAPCYCSLCSGPWGNFHSSSRSSPPPLSRHGFAILLKAPCPVLLFPLQGLSLLWSTYGPWLSFWSCLAVGGRDFYLYPSHLQQTVPRILREWRTKGTTCLVWFWLGALPSCHSQDVGAWRGSSPYRVGLGDTCAAQVNHRDTESQVL